MPLPFILENNEAQVAKLREDFGLEHVVFVA
jgi:hypothetical protein